MKWTTRMTGFLMLSVSAVSAEVFHIPQHFETIQTAIDSAQSGDTLIVHPGMYVESWSVHDKDLTIGSLFLISGDTAVISETRCSATDKSEWGGLIGLKNTRSTLSGLTLTESPNIIDCRLSGIVLDHMRITGNKFDFLGDGCYFEYSDVRISNSSFKNNNLRWSVFWAYESDVILDSVNFIRNFSREDFAEQFPVNAGAMTCRNSRLTMNQVLFQGNGNYFYAGGMECDSCQIQMTGVRFISNSALIAGAGFILRRCGSVTGKDILVEDNYARIGSGFLITDCSVSLEDIRITGNRTHDYYNFGQYGGGWVVRSEIHLNNFLITNNFSAFDGGGLKCEDTDLYLTNGSITGNTSDRGHGGGLVCRSGCIVMENVSIQNNRAYLNGGGLFLASCTLETDANHRISVFDNHASAGSDIWSSLPVTIFADTFTIRNPTGFHLLPRDKFQMDILTGKYEQVTGNVYASPDGDDSYSGRTPEDPVRSLTHALAILDADSLSPGTVHLAAGLYSPDQSNECYPLGPPDYTCISGTSMEETVLDAEGTGSLFIIRNTESLTLQNFTLTGAAPKQNYNILDAYGSCIHCQDSRMQLDHLLFIRNQGRSGDIFYGLHSSVNLSNCVFNQNETEYSSLIKAGHSIVLIRNTTLTGNQLEYSVLNCSDSARIDLVNSIVSESDAPLLSRWGGGSRITICYSRLDSLNFSQPDIDITWGAGNIDSDPLFADPEAGNLHLQAGSPCIDAGIAWMDGWFDLPDSSYSGAAPDMGAFEYGGTATVEPKTEIPYRYQLFQNYPNPFNSQTLITYTLAEPGSVSLVIFNSLGRHVRTLVDGNQFPGSHSVRWSGQDASGTDVSGGLYFCRMTSGGFQKTQKLLLLK